MLYDPDSRHVTNLFRTVNEQKNRDLNRVVCCSKNVIGEAENEIIIIFQVFFRNGDTEGSRCPSRNMEN